MSEEVNKASKMFQISSDGNLSQKSKILDLSELMPLQLVTRFDEIQQNKIWPFLYSLIMTKRLTSWLESYQEY